MKKLFIALLMATTMATTAFATEVNQINFKIQHSFEAEFVEAENVIWTQRQNFAKVDFTLRGKKYEAFYNMQGENIGTSKEINIEELPLSAKRAFAKKYDGYTVTEVIQFYGLDENAYFISAENGTESVILKVGETENLALYKSQK